MRMGMTTMAMGSGGGAGAWTPESLAGTVIYLDGKRSAFTDAGSGDGKITEWKSVHNAAIKMTSPAATNNPVLHANGYIVTNNAATITEKQYLVLPSAITYKTMILLCKQTTTNVANYILGDSSVAGSAKGNVSLRGTLEVTNFVFVLNNNAGVLVANNTNQIAANVKTIVSLTLNAADSVVRIDKVNKSIATNTGTSSAFKELFTRESAFMSLQFTGELYALYANSEVLSSADIVNVEDYLVALHGIG